MKNTIKFLLAAGIIGITASCTDLDVPVESQYTGIPDSEAALEANMANIYFQFRDPLGRRFMEAMTLSSDEWTSASYSGNWVDGYAYAHTAYHDFTYETVCIDWMGVLGRANVLANEVIDSKAEDNYKYAARAMRCFYSFIMMDCYGACPIVDAEYCRENGFDVEERQPRSEVAKWLEKELIEIIPNLPTETTGENYGKPNKYMAQALLAKIYINWAVYNADNIADFDAATAKNEKLDACIAVCDEIIQSRKFELGPDAYRFKFSHDNSDRVAAGTVKDFIYAMPYDTYTEQGMQWGRSHSYKDIKKLNPSMFGEKLNNSGGAYMTVTPECVNRFNLKGDQRNFMLAGLCDKNGNDAGGKVYVYDRETLLPTDEVVKDQKGNDLVFTKDINIVGEVASVDLGDNLEGWRQGYRSVKWFLCDRDYSNGRHQSNDVPIFRYADILLTKAEAMVRSGKSGAKDYFNQIRRYVEAPELSSDPTLNDIYDERGREFFDEIWRRNDMIRFGHYEDEYFPHYRNNPNAKFDTYRRVFPIQKGDLDVNPKWTQNAGY